MNDPDQDLSSYTTAYCDSKAVLEQAWRSGLPKMARILSSSPAMLAEGLAESAFRKFDGKQRTALHDSTLALTQRIHGALEEHDSLAPFAILVARTGILFQPIIELASGLQDEDNDEPRAILLSHTGHGPTDRLFKAPWVDLFANAPKAKCITFNIPMENSYLLRGGCPPGFLTRVKYAAWDKLAYRLFFRYGQNISKAFSRRRAFVYSENELLIETAAWLIFYGFSLHALPKPNIQSPPKASMRPSDLEGRLRDILTPILLNHVKSWVNEKFVESTIELLMEKVLSECVATTATEDHWEELLDRVEVGDGDVILTNYPGDAAIYALTTLCRNKGVPVIAFEHGATRQFCASHKHLAARYENNNADWVMAFNTLSSEMSNANPFARGTSLPVGFPKDYFRNIGRR